MSNGKTTEEFVDEIFVYCLALISLLVDHKPMKEEVVVKESNKTNQLTVKELRKILTDRGVSGVYKLKKNQLLEIL